MGRKWMTGGLLFLSLLAWAPLLLLLISSFYGTEEILECFGGVLVKNGTGVHLHILPSNPTLGGYVELLLDSPGFFVTFWNSVFQVLPQVLGQLLVGVPAAWAFVHFRFPGKKLLFHFYMLLMILPFQVTMVSGYLILGRLHLIDTQAAVALPGIFATFFVFLTAKAFRGIPASVLEAAAIDGAGELKLFLHIAVPLAKPGILSGLLLSFLESWNAMEQPMTFLKTRSRWPLSLYLPNITADKVSVSFCASIVMLLPAVLLFLWGQSFLEQGIAASGLKE